MSGFESAFSFVAEAFRLLTAPAGYGIAVWVLVVVLAWSGIAKLRRPTLAAVAMMDFGVIRRVRPRLGAALGGTEVLLALLLATGILSTIFLPVTAGLFWLFAVLIARSLIAGEDFACFCFGDGDSGLSRLTLVRAAALALLATVLAVAPLPTYASLSEVYLLQAITAAAFVGAIVLGSQVRRLLRWNKDPYRIGSLEANE